MGTAMSRCPILEVGRVEKVGSRWLVSDWYFGAVPEEPLTQHQDPETKEWYTLGGYSLEELSAMSESG